MTIHETVLHYKLIISFFNWYALVWGCIGWGACLSLYAYHIRNGGKRWI